MVASKKVDLELVKSLDFKASIQELMKLPGVGPYTADLSLIVGTRRRDIIHLDLFSREVLWDFYFKGNHVSDKELRDFAARRWPSFQANAIFYLTTNTDKWAKKIGREFRLKSWAKA